MFSVLYKLLVDDRIFTKQISVFVIPANGSTLKVANCAFIVDHHEQDLDAYDDKHYENGTWCEVVRASLDESLHNSDDHKDEIADLIEDGWKEKH